MQPPFPILYEDNHLLVINKPAGIATQGVTDGTSVYDQARAYIKQRYNKPGNVYLGIVSRLDTVTSGVLVLARTSKAASRLSAQIRERSITKLYQAIVEGSIEPSESKWIDWMCKDERRKSMMCCDSDRSGAQQAELKYRCLGRSPKRSLIEVDLVTGRKHQIRVQAAERRHWVVGDRKYGAHSSFPDGIALHASRLQFKHPTTKETLSFDADPPKYWRPLVSEMERI